MNPLEVGLKLCGQTLACIARVAAEPPVFDHDYDNPLDDPDDGGEALEPKESPNELATTVSRLGYDEEDRQWVSSVGTLWKFERDRWWHRDLDGSIWTITPVGFTPDTTGPFTEHHVESLTWEGWAVPAILEVLAEEFPMSIQVCALPAADWRDYIALLIAERIACDPQRAIEALRNHSPKKVIR